MSKRTPQRTVNSSVGGPSSLSVASEQTVDDKLQCGLAQAQTKLEKRIDERFGTFQDTIHDEFVNAFAKQEEEIASRFDIKFEALESRINILTTRMREDHRTRFNILSSRPHQEIHFPARIDDNGSQAFPIQSPGTVGDFCRLKRRLHSLVYLIAFYEIKAYRVWDRYAAASHHGINGESSSSETDEEIQESSDPNDEHMCVEEAVHKHPLFAIQALAAHIGLDYDKIKSMVEPAQPRSSTLAKRSRSQQGRESSPTGMYPAAVKKVVRQSGLDRSSTQGGTEEDRTPTEDERDTEQKETILVARSNEKSSTALDERRALRETGNSVVLNSVAADPSLSPTNPYTWSPGRTPPQG